MTTLLAALRQATEAMTGAGFLPFLFRLTVVTGIGCAALLLARHASAAIRHRIAVAALAASVALPLASLLLPTIALPLLPARTVVEPAVLPGVFQAAASEKPSSDAPRWTALSAAAPAPSSAARPVTTLTGRDLAGLVVLAGWIVSLVLLWRVLTAWLAARRLVRGAAPVVDERVCAEFDGAHLRLGIRRLVALLESDRILVPVVCGIVRPALLVPCGARGWSRERLRSVMYHELAHVARNDGLALVLTRVATALLWFHPLVWVLAHQARLACEQACDDVVLGDGARASAYAEELLTIARDAGERDPLQGLAPAFAQRSTLERRLVAILAPGVRRGPASWAVSLAIGAVALVLALSLASVRVVAAPPVARPDARPIWLADAKGSTPAVREEQVKGAESAAEQLADRTVPAAMRRNASEDGGDWFEKAKDRYDDERYAEAALAYIEAAQAGYRPATAYYNAACSFSLDGQKERALEALSLALDEGFGNADLIARDDDLDAIRSSPRFRQLLARARNTDPAKARGAANLKRYERLRAEHSDDEDAWKDVGIDLMRSGQAVTAAQAFATQFAIDSSASALYNQACAWSLAGRPSEALKSLQRSIESGYGDAKYMQRDDDLNALHGTAGFEQLLDLARDLELSGPLLGREDVRSWRNELSRYEHAARDHAQLGRAWSNLGYARLATKNPQGSAEAYRRSLELGYHVSTSMYNLACAYAQMRQTDDAIRWLERSETAGMDVRDMALSDDDLDPIRGDARFQRMADRWREERRAERRKEWEKAQKD